jgi:hypothetical protein
MYRDVQQVFGHCNFFAIFHTGIQPQFFKTFQTQFLFDFDDNLNTKQNFERQKYNTMIVHLKTNNLSLHLNHEYLKSVLPKIFKNNHRNLHTFSLLTFCW